MTGEIQTAALALVLVFASAYNIGANLRGNALETRAAAAAAAAVAASAAAVAPSVPPSAFILTSSPFSMGARAQAFLWP